MPFYIFESPDETETIEVFFGMNDKKEYFDEKGIEWKRVYVGAQIAAEGLKVDPFSSKDYIRKTNTKGTIGDLIDRSRDMSDARAQIAGGHDPIAVERQVKKQLEQAEKKVQRDKERRAAAKKREEKK